MRLIGTLEGRARTELFVGYLNSKQISTQCEAQTGATDVWEIWIRDEDAIDRAKQELERFRLAPDLKEYENAKVEAERLLREKQKKRVETAQLQRKVQFSGRTARRTAWPPPITFTLIAISAVVSLLTNFGSPATENTLGTTLVRQLMFINQADYVQQKIAAPERRVDPATSLEKGQLWRVFTPIFLHFHPLHLLFNVLVMVRLGGALERADGPLRYAFVILITAVASSLLQGLLPEKMFGEDWLGGSPMFGGLSGVGYGLFGFLWVRVTTKPSWSAVLSPGDVVMMLLWLVLGFSGMLGPIANMAHLGGLLSGIAIGWIASRAA